MRIGNQKLSVRACDRRPKPLRPERDSGSADLDDDDGSRIHTNTFRADDSIHEEEEISVGEKESST